MFSPRGNIGLKKLITKKGNYIYILIHLHGGGGVTSYWVKSRGEYWMGGGGLVYLVWVLYKIYRVFCVWFVVSSVCLCKVSYGTKSNPRHGKNLENSNPLQEELRQSKPRQNDKRQIKRNSQKNRQIKSKTTQNQKKKCILQLFHDHNQWYKSAI